MKKIIYAMKDLLKNYFNWHGRLSREGYLWSWAGILAVNMILFFIRKTVLFLASFLYSYEELISKIMTYATRIWYIVMFIPILFATMRRYHDSEKAGWKALVFIVFSPIFTAAGFLYLSIIAIAFVFGGGYMVTAEADVPLGRLLVPAALSGFLILAGIGFGVLNIIYIFRRSNPKENKYGEPMPFNPPERI